LPPLGPTDVLVEMVGVGICHTDLVSRDGNLGAQYPSVFGHEGSGVVQAVGYKVSKLTVGDHVVLSPASDGTCTMCLRGAPMYCDQFNALNLQMADEVPTGQLAGGEKVRLKYFGQSSFSRHAIASERNAIKVPNDVPLEILGPLGCGIQTGAGTLLNGLLPPAGSSVVILGAGAVGLAALLAAVIRQCHTIIMVDRSTPRLAFAQELGATHVINTEETPDLQARIRDICIRGVDYVVDCAGVPSLIAASLGSLAPLGTLGLVAVPPTMSQKLEVPWFSLMNGGQRIQGFVEGNSVPEVFIPHLVDLYREGSFPFDRLIKSYAFEQINEAVDEQESGKVLKSVLKFS